MNKEERKSIKCEEDDVSKKVRKSKSATQLDVTHNPIFTPRALLIEVKFPINSP